VPKQQAEGQRTVDLVERHLQLQAGAQVPLLPRLFQPGRPSLRRASTKWWRKAFAPSQSGSAAAMMAVTCRPERVASVCATSSNCCSSRCSAVPAGATAAWSGGESISAAIATA
jgi:hypothetical protein